MAILVFKEKDGTINTVVTGKVTREPEVKSSAKGDKVKFSVAYGKKKYMQVEAWSDSDVGNIASCLEKGDIVCASGEYKEWEYNNKVYSAITADAIFSMQMPVAAAVAPSAAPSQTAKSEKTQYVSGKFEDIEYDDSDGDDDLPF